MPPYHRLACLLALVCLSACLPSNSADIPVNGGPPTPSPTGTSMATNTATVVWFPPTTTFTPFPTQGTTPTPDQRPGIGALIFSDGFTEGEAWSLGRTEQGSAAIGKGELTIALFSPKAYYFSTRQEPVLEDFYAEITASPSLCQGVDEYGMLLRYTGPASYYRFSLSCDGRARLDRVVSGQASSPQPWLQSGAVPPGAPSSSRLGVWSVGDELRFFVNDEYQFTVKDPLLASGTLGVFARAAGDQAVTVNFSELVVYQIDR